MNWQQFREEYGEGPEDHFEDGYEYARYLERRGDHHRASAVRARRKKMENGEIAEDEQSE